VSAENEWNLLEQQRVATPRPTVTAAIVTYCSRKELPACLDSVLASTVPIKAVVIDNASPDGTLALAEEYARRHPNIVAVSSGGNIGLSAGNNVVMPHLEGDYALMLNPDTVLQPDTLAAMIAKLESDPKIGVVGPKCLYEDGSPHTSYHRSWSLWHLFIWRVTPYSAIRRLYDTMARYGEREVGFVSGACLLVRADLFREVGGYDPMYFLTVEDVCDLCVRIRERGYKTVFTPSAQIVHLCGRSGAQVPYLTTLEAYKGDVYHFFKHGGRLRGYTAYGIVVFACAVKTAVSLLKALLLRRSVDRQNLRVYRRILPTLLATGPRIAYSAER
jgi:GT2 family glycosyltransferase